MSFQHTIKIPKERIGVLIGKGGRVKQQIEKRCRVLIEIDSDTGDAMIMSNKSADHLEAFRALEAITAISRGFSPERAYRLFDDNELMFQQIDLRDYTGKSQNALGRIKGRVIGEGGKARRMIEELSGSSISVYGHTVCLIGNFREVKLATDAIAMLAKGSMHKTVYRMLQGAKGRDKMDRMRLWEDSYDEVTSSES
ncbi:MAG: KH domain-containing protein [Thermoproteota archaeon]|jgi:ribosomal RNA assembly protein|nr:KH domain-containing protein [Thermoproteota archaeon]